MISVHHLIQQTLRQIIVCFAMVALVFPTAAHAALALTEPEQSYEVMVLDQQEESEKEEQQEDDSKDEKIEMQFCNADALHISFTSEHAIYNPMDAASDYIQDIPFPPPERE